MAESAVVVDLDGTLWDSASWYAEITDHRTRAGLPAARALRAAGFTKTSFARRVESDAAPLFDGVAHALRSLRSRGVRLGVVTNLPRWVALPMLSSHQIAALFDAIICYEDTRSHKPSPDPLIRCVEVLDLAPQLCTYVGDDKNDFVAAQAAGMRFAWAAWGYGSMPPGDYLTLNGAHELEALHGSALS